MPKQREGSRPPRAGVPEFLYEDADIVVVVKPEGLPVIAPEGSRSRNLLDLVSERLKRRYPRGRAALVHRLDRDTSGVMVFATCARSKKILMDAWAERARDRRYVALVEGRMEAEAGLLDSWIAPAGPSRMRVARPGERDAQRALGSWKLIDSGGGYSLIEVSLETGRKHQIRVQLSALGHPVAGDIRYGSRSDPAGRLMLHASVLEILHPGNDEARRFECPLPPSFKAALRGGRPPDDRSPSRGAEGSRPAKGPRAAASGKGVAPARRGDSAGRPPARRPGPPGGAKRGAKAPRGRGHEA